MTNHHPAPNPPGGPAPTAKQQAYIRRLALERGISFTPPQTRAQASKLIDELKRRRPDLRADQRRDTRNVQDEMQRGAQDAVRVQDAELQGHGSSATWRQVRTSTTTPSGVTTPAVTLGRYTTSLGEQRLVQGQRILGIVRVTDIPAEGSGRRYLIERELHTRAELVGLVADYLQQAHQLQAIPADPASLELGGGS
jgi:hypothetical protein